MSKELIEDSPEWERQWWGTCQNTLGEEIKQLVYAKKIGLKLFHDTKTPYNFTVVGNILDIGGGPVSMLLKCPHAKGVVVDPCEYPYWIEERYKCAGIKYEKKRGEDVDEVGVYDEVWIYNVLQHVDDPEKIVKNAKKAGKLIRIFEWIGIQPCEGHPHMLTEEGLNKWLGGYGKVEALNEQGCRGEAYYGVFI
jgi:2-polyprenyl-3-methyl-5-hydroxy-6-metoxy-1,4-benzoquinol methylase